MNETLHAKHPHGCQIRFYAELNDFLPPDHQYRSFAHAFAGHPSVKDLIEALGVPHTEVDLILIDGEPASFATRLLGGERVTVFPLFERLDIGSVNRLRPQPLRHSTFILDVHLGRLARYLRLLGFDSWYRNDYADERIIHLANRRPRIILTRDRGLLKQGRVQRGYWVRQVRPAAQLAEVVQALDLRQQIRPFSRCLHCNGELEPIPPEQAASRLPASVRRSQTELFECRVCARLYWPGSHYRRMRSLLEQLQLVPAASEDRWDASPPPAGLAGHKGL